MGEPDIPISFLELTSDFPWYTIPPKTHTLLLGTQILLVQPGHPEKRQTSTCSLSPTGGNPPSPSCSWSALSQLVWSCYLWSPSLSLLHSLGWQHLTGAPPPVLRAGVSPFAVFSWLLSLCFHSPGPISCMKAGRGLASCPSCHLSAFKQRACREKEIATPLIPPLSVPAGGQG